MQRPAVMLNGPIEEGTPLVFQAWNLATHAYENVPATCRKVGLYCYVFVADDQWNTRVDQTQVDELARTFDDQTGTYPDRGIYEVVTSTFGSPPDVDNDPRIALFVLDIQDGYGNGSDNYYAGYFDDQDQFSGNRRDMLYLDTYPADLSSDEPKATLAHEFQHLVHWRHDPDEERWVNEGCSGYAELVTGYATNSGSAFADHPDDDLTEWSETLIDYDQTFMFITYLGEQYGGSEFIRQLVWQTHNGITGINMVLSYFNQPVHFEEVFADWAVANYVDDEGKYGHRAIDVPTFRVTVQPHLPVPDTLAQISAWAADYVVFTSGENLDLRFDNAESGTYRIYVVSKKDRGIKVDELELEGTGGTFSATDADTVVLIVARTFHEAGSYFYGADRAPDIVAYEETDGAVLPTQWALYPNYPNPFNASTALPFWVPDGQPSFVLLEIYDVAGQKVITLMDGPIESGKYYAYWQGTDAAGHPVGSGLYIAQLKAKNIQLIQKVMVLR